MIVLPELSRLSLKANLAIEFAVWCLMRENTQLGHSGHYTKKHAKNLAHNLRFTTRHWTRIFNNGHNVFWGNDGKMLHMRSLSRVIKSLEKLTDDKIDTRTEFLHPVRVSIVSSDTTQMIRAKLYHSWFLRRGSVTIARDTIQDTFGLSHDQQRAYEALLGDRMRVYSNHVHVDSDDYNDNPQPLPDYTYDFRYDRYASDNSVKQAKMYAYQIPNTYIALPINAGLPAPRISKNARKSCLVRLWYTKPNYNQKTLYHANMSDFVRRGTTDSYVYVGFQHTKRIFKSGHYI